MANLPKDLIKFQKNKKDIVAMVSEATGFASGDVAIVYDAIEAVLINAFIDGDFVAYGPVEFGTVIKKQYVFNNETYEWSELLNRKRVCKVRQKYNKEFVEKQPLTSHIDKEAPNHYTKSLY